MEPAVRRVQPLCGTEPERRDRRYGLEAGYRRGSGIDPPFRRDVRIVGDVDQRGR